MKFYFFLFLKIYFAPVWISYLLIKKFWRFITIAILGFALLGCASNSAKLDISPCAGCDFSPVNRIHYLGEKNA